MATTYKQIKTAGKELRASCIKKRNLDKSEITKAMTLAKNAFKMIYDIEIYEVQIEAAITMYRGNLIDMKTGEGKTIAAILTAYLYSLTGQTCHIITVNDYLVKRDFTYASKIFKLLGVRCGYITRDSTKDTRKDIYRCDVVYLTNFTLCADYINNLTCTTKNDILPIKMEQLIIDEADSILIDYGSMPVLTSYNFDVDKESIKNLMSYVEDLDSDDVYLCEDDGNYHLTEKGIAAAIEYFKLNNYFSSENKSLRMMILDAIKARYIYKKDVHYTVLDDKIYILNKNNGYIDKDIRLLYFQHQFLEAKEHVPVLHATKPGYMITYQELFSRYEQFTGMSGTLFSERRYIKDVYGKKVASIPLRNASSRIDHKDIIQENKAARNMVAIGLVKKTVLQNRPVLIMANNISEAEIFSKELKVAGIAHHLISGKNEYEQANIISEAGKCKCVTVATNLIGRGVDIKVDDEANEAGGLLIIALERFPSKRIDDQVRGRTARQGAPGETQFIVSLEDASNQTFAKRLNRLRRLEAGLEDMESGKSFDYTDKKMQAIIEDAQKERTQQAYRKFISNIEFSFPSAREFCYLGEFKNTLLTCDDEEAMNLLTALFQKNKMMDKPLNIMQKSREESASMIIEKWQRFFENDRRLQQQAIYSSYKVDNPLEIYEMANNEYYSDLLKDIRKGLKEIFMEYTSGDKNETE
ncbi:DEAD/DEAH box helicase [[Clostridium] innocuum]|uniref:preprotein translocase subunit SecA n=1 Tax=Clostridium innocuum TaxID=1522 RepID=UPI000D6B1A85|nr:DEAD/DEAH box helicase [[Clostridium] innocuum]PWJ11995.1 preprotein translocase subunit SecA [[Clostridium] innocuum]SSA47563.1 preprotein translocase subunit SecA [[Clostridium] innocuum]